MTTTPITTSRDDLSNRLTEIAEPSGETVTFAYNANGQRDQQTVTTGGSNPTTYQVNDTYQNGRLEAYTWEVRVRYTLRQGQAAGEIAARTAA